MTNRGPFIATMISLASAAFGFVAALAWNAFIIELLKQLLGAQGGLVGLLIYAVVVTIIAVIVIVWLGNMATKYQTKSTI